MRCTRCDRILTREHLGRSLDDRLLFGLCPACLVDEGREVDDGPALPLSVHTRASLRVRLRRVARRARRLRRARGNGGRLLAMVGFTGLLAAVALILAFVSGVKLHQAADKNAPRDFKAAFLLVGSGVFAVMSLALWLALIARDRRLRVGLKVIRVASTIAGFGTLFWAILNHDPRNDIWVVLVVVGAFAVSWTVHRIERRRANSREPTTSATL